MHFESLRVTQFRNHAAQDFALAADVHAFAGPNGVGKTNLLEAVHYLCLARGFRSQRSADREAVQQGETYFLIEGAWAEAGQVRRIQCNYREGKGKRLLVDGRPLARLSEHVGRIPVVTLLPDDSDLIRDAAAVRRRWLDMLLAQGSPAYLQALSRYERALDQRNALLSRWAEPGGLAFDADELALWDAPLAEAGAAMYALRTAFAAEFAPVLLAQYAHIAEGRETPGLVYESDAAATPAAYRDGLRRALAADRAAGRSTWGVHRDDLGLLLDGRAIRGHGSQGQQKSFLVALKLAQHRYLHAATGRPPVLLFDDVFDKLDAARAARIFALVCQALPGQKLLTDTSAERLRAHLKVQSGIGWDVSELAL